MSAQTAWLWLLLGVGCLLARLAEALTLPSACELAPCTCARGRLTCDCSKTLVQDIKLRKEMFDSLNLVSVSVQHCQSLHVAPEAWRDLPALQLVMVSNVSRLVLEERSFSFRPADETPQDDTRQMVVNISRVLVPEIPSYCFRGLLRAVLMSETYVEVLRPYAFSALDRLDQLAFHSVHLALVEPQAFKKLTVQILSFVDTNVTTFTKNAMINVEVLDEMRLERVKVDRVKTNAINVHSARNVKIVQSSFGVIERQAFNVITQGDVSIHENTFKNIEKWAFVGFTVDNKYVQQAGKQDLIFENNTLTSVERLSLTFNTSGFSPRLDWIMMNIDCSCDSIDFWTSDLVLFSSDLSSATAAPQINTIMFCKNPAFKRVKDFQTFVCQMTKSSLLIKILIALGVIVIVAFSVALMWYCYMRRRSKRYINVPTSSALKVPGANKGHMLVVPEGKTYRETELHVIVEHAEPIVSREYVKERPDRDSNE